MPPALTTKIPHNLTEKLQRWLPRLVNVLLVIGIGWLVYPLVLPYLPVTDKQAPEPAPVKPAETREAEQPEINTQQIAAWHLLGEATETSETEQSRAPIDAPETKLQLSLKGIISTDNNTQGYAIIQKPNGEEQHFKVSDNIFGLAMLEEIYVTHIILLRDGRYETLRLPIEFIASDLIMERARKQEAKRIVSDFRQKLINRDGMALIKMFGFDTTFRNGGFAGFTIKIAGEDGASMLEALGLKEDDLITAVNGKRFSESLEATQSLTKLKDATEVDIEIDRKGVPMFFHFDFADLEQAAEQTGEDTTATSTGNTEAASTE